jgi:hypothetical protein
VENINNIKNVPSFRRGQQPRPHRSEEKADPIISSTPSLVVSHWTHRNSSEEIQKLCVQIKCFQGKRHAVKEEHVYVRHGDLNDIVNPKVGHKVGDLYMNLCGIQLFEWKI